MSRTHTRNRVAAATVAIRSAPAHRSATQAASDLSLVARIATGEPLAMQVLFARHNVRVFRFVKGIVKDHTLTEDIVGDVFLEVWRQARRFEERATVSTWLLAIARYKALDAIRSARVHDDLDAAVDVADAADGPESVALTQSRDEVLRGCIAKLSPSHREILDLVYYQDMPIEAVARIVGTPLNTVKTRMFYARKHLAGLLQEAGVDRAAA